MVAKTSFENRQVEVIDSITCNSCATVFDDPYKFEGIASSKTFGYHSRVYGDMTSIELHICQVCLEQIAKNFKIPVAVDESFWGPTTENNNDKS